MEEAKARKVNPARKSIVKPLRQICDQTDTLLAASAAELVPNVLGFLSFGAYQQCREGDPDAWATQVLHVSCPCLPLEGYLMASIQYRWSFPTTDAVQWVQIYGLTRLKDADDMNDDEVEK